MNIYRRAELFSLTSAVIYYKCWQHLLLYIILIVRKLKEPGLFRIRWTHGYQTQQEQTSATRWCPNHLISCTTCSSPTPTSTSISRRIGAQPSWISATGKRTTSKLISFEQCFGSGSKSVDTDSESGSGSRRAKMTHKNGEKLRKFIFWSDGCSLLRAEGFFFSLDVLYRGLGIGKLQFLIKIIFNFFSCPFFNFWSSKPWILIGIQPKMLDPDPDEINSETLIFNVVNSECCRIKW